MVEFQRSFKASLHSDVKLINTVIAYISRKKGKQLRPRLCLLSAKMCGDSTPLTYKAAALIEMIQLLLIRNICMMPIKFSHIVTLICRAGRLMTGEARGSQAGSPTGGVVKKKMRGTSIQFLNNIIKTRDNRKTLRSLCYCHK